MELLAALAIAVTLGVDGRSNSTPSVAALGRFVVVAWSASDADGATDIFAAASRDGARTFGAPVRVNHISGDARVNGEQPPRVVLAARTGDPSIVIVWTTKGSAGTKLVSARSGDGGRSFAPAVTVPQSEAAGNRGWQNAVADSSGRVYTVWLDHREMADHSMAAGHHQHGEDSARAKPASSKPDGVAMTQMSKLYVGTLDAAIPPRPVTPGVCYCCKTALATGATGSLYVAWRHVYPGNMRDIAFMLSRDGGRTFAAPVRVSEDRWMLEGCPDDGPGLAVDARGRIHVVWPTLVTDERSGEPAVGIFYATSADGRQFTPRVRVPTEGIAHHPQIVVGADGIPVLAWDEGLKGIRRVVLARLSPASRGSPAFARVVLEGEQAVYPSIAAGPDGAIVAATAPRPTGSVIRIHLP